MYTIKILKGGEAKRDRVLDYLRERMAKEDRFSADLHRAMDGRLPSIHVKPVRLVKAKLYNGQQPGGYQNGYFQQARKTCYLEWNDWVRFHGLVNRVLNRFRTDADVWTNPPYIQGRFWVRRGIKARIHYTCSQKLDKFGRMATVWNYGDESQFVKNLAAI